jgi:hypothetical protein
MSATLPDQIPDDWYADAFDAASAGMAWTDRTVPEGDGAIGYLESDDENLKTFEVIARALTPGGRNLIHLPSVLYAEERLAQRSWIPASDMIELVEHRIDKKAKRMEGKMVAARSGEVLENLDRIEFSQRLYSIEELRQIYASVDMELLNVYHGSGRPREPKPGQFEVFVEVGKTE